MRFFLRLCERMHTYGLVPRRYAKTDNLKRFSVLPFLNLAISKMQETSHWPAHRWNVVSEQRKSNWQHPNAYYREREKAEHSATDECDTSRHSHPYRTLSTKAVQTMTDPGGDVLLEAIHFLVEIRNAGHPRSSGRYSVRSDGRHAAEPLSGAESLKRQLGSRNDVRRFN
jgi:hypothetical protein